MPKPVSDKQQVNASLIHSHSTRVLGTARSQMSRDPSCSRRCDICQSCHTESTYRGVGVGVPAANNSQEPGVKKRC
ncbi:hypothetical protein BJX63DRAFT_382418 [Aspergillus granulosus]|uniref:Uncharacterized protein n=1 Tax=Aspergillus granulosus TaxID=176169 RepID=A0ABR4HUF0_9EURO